MPKVNKKYYARARQIANASINIVESNHYFPFNINTPLVSSSVSELSSLVLERDDLVSMETNLNKKLDKNLSLTLIGYNDNSVFLNNDEEAISSENNDVGINTIINKDSSINCNFLDNLEHYEDNNINFTSQLQGWAIRNRITHVALNELITILKPKYPELPRCARTLLGTVRKVNVKDVEPGRYYHFGINYCLEKLVETSQCSLKYLKIIEIIINIDGLPLSKSSGSQVYPILCSLSNNYNNVGMIGIYHGYEKPKDANKFLESFVNEAQDLITRGITVNGIIYPFKIKAFICDVPALSFIKYTKGHSGYYSCAICDAKGEYYLNRVCFPYLEISNAKTDKKFRI